MVGHPAPFLPAADMSVVVVPPSVLLFVALQSSLSTGSSARGRLVRSHQGHYFLEGILSTERLHNRLSRGKGNCGIEITPDYTSPFVSTYSIFPRSKRTQNNYLTPKAETKLTSNTNTGESVLISLSLSLSAVGRASQLIVPNTGISTVYGRGSQNVRHDRKRLGNTGLEITTIQPYILYRILFEVGSYLYVSIDNLVTRIVRLLYPLKL